MQMRITALTAAAVGLTLAGRAGASPRLEIGPLSRRLQLTGLRACFTAQVPATSEVGLRFLTTGSVVSWLDPQGRVWPLLRGDLYGVVTDPEWGALLCTSRGVYATGDGRILRRLTSMVFTRVVAAPVGGVFAHLGDGLYGFDGKQFQMIRAIPWSSVESLGLEPGGAVWFVGTYRRPDGSTAPQRLYVARDHNGGPVIDDPLPAESSASAVADYYGGIVSTIDGRLRGTMDGGAHWYTVDEFGRTDLTLTSLPLYAGEPWQALWIGVREARGGPAPLWFDDYSSGLVAQPIDAARVLQITADLSRRVMLFVADDALYEAPYDVLEDDPGP